LIGFWSWHWTGWICGAAAGILLRSSESWQIGGWVAGSKHTRSLCRHRLFGQRVIGKEHRKNDSTYQKSAQRNRVFLCDILILLLCECACSMLSHCTLSVPRRSRCNVPPVSSSCVSVTCPKQRCPARPCCCSPQHPASTAFNKPVCVWELHGALPTSIKAKSWISHLAERAACDSSLRLIQVQPLSFSVSLLLPIHLSSLPLSSTRQTASGDSQLRDHQSTCPTFRASRTPHFLRCSCTILPSIRGIGCVVGRYFFPFFLERTT